MKRIAPKRDTEEIDTVAMSSRQFGDRRAFDVLMEAQHYWSQMDDFRKDAYKKYLMWDVASMAGLLFFVLNFSQEGSMMLYIGLVLYFIGSKQKRPYQSAYLGDVTKEDVEAAKAAVVDVEAEDVQETTEE